ncbi:hypothetical protein [Rhizobium sp. P32RR-XVIII]|nr:hypothetical protein [Rhizobium sp. P32RR-XVIII]
MTKAAFISAVFAGYVAVMFALASIPNEMPPEISQAQSTQAVN